MLPTDLLCLALVLLLLIPGESASSSRNDSTSLRQIIRNVRQINVTLFESSEEKENYTLTFTLPCSYDEGDDDDDASRRRRRARQIPLIQESTASLLAAKALAKTVLPLGETMENVAGSLDSMAWDMLDTVLFPTAEIEPEDVYDFQSKGLLPKYWYFDKEQGQHQPQPTTDYYYLKGTRFPHWSLFQLGQKNNANNASRMMIESSQRLSALPLHASLLWDMLLAVIPPQPQQQEQEGGDHDNNQSPYSYNYDQNKDWWDRVDDYFQAIYENHAYLHTVVMRGCKSQGSSPVPCYNILHPWEGLMDATSPAWETALQAVMETIQRENWTLPFKVPSLVKESYDFPSNPKVYNAMMYLFLEGWSKVDLTKVCPQENDDDDDDEDKWCPEEALFNRTQFAVLDVGYAAILSQADADLAQLGWVLRQVLPDTNSRKRLDQQVQSLHEWRNDNFHVLQELLWHPTHYSYLSRYYSVGSGKMEWMEDALSNNLIPFWNTAAASRSEEEDTNNDNSNSNNHAKSPKRGRRFKDFSDDNDPQMRQLAKEHMQDLSLQLLLRQGNYSFDCGPFPLWSHGGCEMAHPANSTKIQPLVNYLIGNGLLRGDTFQTFGHYIAGQTLELLQHEFGEAYRATSPYDNLATLDNCGSTCTLTAAVVYNLQVPDPAHTNRLPLPPIRESWVITLITFELLIAFSIGVSCLVLSFNLVRKLRVYSPIPIDEEDEYDNYDSYDEPEQEEDGTSPQHYDSTGTSLPDLRSSSQSNEVEPSQSSFFSSNGLN